MKRLRLLLLFFGMVMVLSFMVSCKPSVPSTFISPGDMEDLLYDYHMADAMAEQAKGNYAENVIAYRAAVLKKYGVTQEKFDTSMVYYMRHADQLHTIYEHVAQRLQDKAQELGTSVGTAGNFTANGDTTDIWKESNSVVLIPNEPYNLYSFSMMADSAFHKGDTYVLNFQSDFIYQDGTRDGVVVLSLVYRNDSVAQRVMHFSSSSKYDLSIDDPNSLGIKEVKGFFLLARNNDMNSSMTTLKMACVSHIHLFRVHAKKEGAQGNLAAGAAGPNGPDGSPQPMPANAQMQMAPDSMRRP